MPANREAVLQQYCQRG